MNNNFAMALSVTLCSIDPNMSYNSSERMFCSLNDNSIILLMLVNFQNKNLALSIAKIKSNFISYTIEYYI